MLTKLVISRSLWGRGALLTGDGRMCCLGHASLACGVPKDALSYGDPSRSSGRKALPDHDWDTKYGVPSWMCEGGECRSHATDASSVNDDVGLSDYAREVELISIFKRHGIELSFED